MSDSDSAAPQHQPQTVAAPTPSARPPATSPNSNRRRLLRIVVAFVVLALLLLYGIPWIINALNTVSTDDAYVNGHVTFVAPRVSGQVSRVLVDDNNRVRKGDLLVELDDEPYRVKVNIAQSAVEVAQADLTAAGAEARALVGQTRALRFGLQHAIEEVNSRVALLRSRVATLNSQQATLSKTKAEYDRVVKLFATQAVGQDDLDIAKEAYLVSKARVEEALQGVYEVRIGLGLPATPESGDDLTQVPPDLDQTFSAVRRAEADLIKSASQLGVVDTFNKSPKQLVADFYKRDPSGDIDRIYAALLANAPGVKQAEAKLAAAQRLLDDAELNLRYCRVVAEIDGVVTRRSVNPGNNVVAGQDVMAVRSLTEIWVDANFKETQIAELRIGQAVDLDVDTYGKRQRFRGRISGFTMGTGSTLALLPAENATGNFVKVVQRLPVRIELIDYDPDKSPLFIGLSVTPTVHLREEPTGPSAGKVLQPYAPPATQTATQP